MAQYSLAESPCECKPATLSFGNVQFSTIDRDGQPWFRSGEIARALDYKDESSIRRLYDRNAEEFTENMTQVIEIVETVNLTVRVRIFSLRGCHLLAMFARTLVAKAFRKWVLDVLDKLAEEERARFSAAVKSLPAAELSAAHRSELKAIVDAKLSAFPASIQGKARSEIWTRFNRHFRIAEYAQLPAERMAEARDYLIEMEVKALKALPSIPTTPPVALQSSSPSTPGILSAELARYAAEFEAIAHTVEDLEQLLVQVRRLSYPLTSEAARTLAGGQAGARGHLEAVLEEHLGRSHRLAQELVPCARLGINVMRDLARAQGR